MALFEVEFEGKNEVGLPVKDNVKLSAVDTDEAEMFGREYIRDIYPELSEIKISVKENV